MSRLAQGCDECGALWEPFPGVPDPELCEACYRKKFPPVEPLSAQTPLRIPTVTRWIA